MYPPSMRSTPKVSQQGALQQSTKDMESDFLFGFAPLKQSMLSFCLPCRERERGYFMYPPSKFVTLEVAPSEGVFESSPPYSM
jgi:hypothetical protein